MTERKERKVEIEDVGAFVWDEVVFGLKTFVAPITAVASAFSSALRETDPYKLSELKTAGDTSDRPQAGKI